MPGLQKGDEGLGACQPWLLRELLSDTVVFPAPSCSGKVWVLVKYPCPTHPLCPAFPRDAVMGAWAGNCGQDTKMNEEVTLG